MKSARATLICLGLGLVLTGCGKRDSAATVETPQKPVKEISSVSGVTTGTPGTAPVPAAVVAPVALSAPPVAGHTNSLGMIFKSVPGTTVLFSIYESRVSDYGAFAQSAKRSVARPSFAQTGSHPVVNVSWEDATAFCQWLTEHEKQKGTLPVGGRYRLPTDEEWSVAVGLLDAVIGSSRPRDPAVAGVYPWGKEWPPPPRAGNYSQELGLDPFEYTSPVGSFAPNQHGLCDMGGNVWEWCADRYEESEDLRVLRGSSWRMRNPGDLLSSMRVGNVGNLKLPVYGFRAVLEISTQPSPSTPPPVIPATPVQK